MAASNTRECFSECIGKRVVGVLFDALPFCDPSTARGTKTLVFDDGSGLTINNNGTFWRELAEDVNRAIRKRKQELERVRAEIADVLAISGAISGSGS